MDKPHNYGACWTRRDADLDWYTWMHDGRIEQHLAFQRWFAVTDRAERIETVLELGCGLAVGYADFFSGISYTGSDLASRVIDWCRHNRNNSRHRYVACDFIEETFPNHYDLVFSHGTIDNSYDMDAFLQAAVRASRRWVYITAYRGFFPELETHRIDWRESDGCFYNDLSPARAAENAIDDRIIERHPLPSTVVARARPDPWPQP